MKKIIVLTFAAILFAYTYAQPSETGNIKEIGDFLLIDLKTRTSVDNTFDNFNEVEKVLLRKNAIVSVVVYQKKSGKKEMSEIEAAVLITTTEHTMHHRSGSDSKSMSNASKHYEILFKNKSSAETFAIELIESCK